MYRSPTRFFPVSPTESPSYSPSRLVSFLLLPFSRRSSHATLATSSFLFLPLVGSSRVVSSRNLERYLLDDLEQRRERASRFTSTYEMLRGARKFGRIVPDHDRIRRSTVPEPSGRYRLPVVTSCTRSPPRENQPAMVGVELSRPSRSSPQHTTRPILSSPSQPPLTPSQTPRKPLAKPLFSPLCSLSLLPPPTCPLFSSLLLSTTPLPIRLSPTLPAVAHLTSPHPSATLSNTTLPSSPRHPRTVLLLFSSPPAASPCHVLPRLSFPPIIAIPSCNPLFYSVLFLFLYTGTYAHTHTHTYTNARWSTRERNLFRIRQRPIPTCFPFFHLRCSYQQFLFDLPLS